MPHDDLRWRVDLKIEGLQLGDDVMQLVEEVVVDQALDKADMISLVMANPIIRKPGQKRTSELMFADSVAFMPGNTIEVFAGYGNKADVFVGAGILRKWKPNFPSDGIPKLRLKALDATCLMMDGSNALDCKQARTFDAGVELSEMVTSVLGDYPITPRQIGATSARPAYVTVKRAGMSDYIFVRGLANLVNYDFNVTWDPKARRWDARWDRRRADYSKKKTFTWGPDFASRTEGGVLVQFEPEFAIQNVSTNIEVFYFDSDSRTWEKIVYPPEEAKSSDKAEFRWKGDEKSVEQDLARISTPDSNRGLRIKADGISVEVIPLHNFRSQEEAVEYAKSWWSAKQDLLIQGSGTIIGYPDLRPNQVHVFEGLGTSLSGEWYIHSCRHIFKKGGVYKCDFLARKVIP